MGFSRQEYRSGLPFPPRDNVRSDVLLLCLIPLATSKSGSHSHLRGRDDAGCDTRGRSSWVILEFCPLWGSRGRGKGVLEHSLVGHQSPLIIAQDVAPISRELGLQGLWRDCRRQNPGVLQRLCWIHCCTEEQGEALGEDNVCVYTCMGASLVAQW